MQDLRFRDAMGALSLNLRVLFSVIPGAPIMRSTYLPTYVTNLNRLLREHF